MVNLIRAFRNKIENSCAECSGQAVDLIASLELYKIVKGLNEKELFKSFKFLAVAVGS